MQETQAASATGTGELYGAAAELLGVYLRSTGSAGSAVLKDGGGSGTTKLTINTPAAVGWIYIPIPGRGIAFGTDVYATLTAVDGIMVLYR